MFRLEIWRLGKKEGKHGCSNTYICKTVDLSDTISSESIVVYIRNVLPILSIYDSISIVWVTNNFYIDTQYRYSERAYARHSLCFASNNNNQIPRNSLSLFITVRATTNKHEQI